MSKGLNLEEFRERLDTDAQKRVITQEETIKRLQEDLKIEVEYSKKLKAKIEIFENRCMALTKGHICLFCEYKFDCKAFRYRIMDSDEMKKWKAKIHKHLKI